MGEEAAELPEAVSLSPVTASGEAPAKQQPSGVDGKGMGLVLFFFFFFKEKWPLKTLCVSASCAGWLESQHPEAPTGLPCNTPSHSSRPCR